MAAKGYTSEALVEAEVLTDIDTTTKPTTTQVATWIEEAESLIDERTGTSFTAGTVTDAVLPFDVHNTHRSSIFNFGYSVRADRGRFTLIDSVYLTDENQKRVRPIISISSLSRNEASGNTASDDWDSLTENTGSSGDYIVDKQSGLVSFHQNAPTLGLTRGIKWSGNFGFASIPAKVKTLATKLVARRVIQAKIKWSHTSSPDSFTLEGFSNRKNTGQLVNYLKELDREIEELFKEITGAFSSDISK